MRCSARLLLQASFADTRKMLLETTISRETCIAEGEWWYSVQGVNVNDSQAYTL